MPNPEGAGRVNRTEWFHKRCVPSLLKLDLERIQAPLVQGELYFSALYIEKLYNNGCLTLPAKSHTDYRGNVDSALTSCP